MDDLFPALISAAIRAPSGDNVQPWRFEVDSDHRQIVIYVDEQRDPSPMNAAQRMSRIAVGAATENLVRAAWGTGWTTELTPLPNSQGVIVRLEGRNAGEGVIAPEITARVTNRRFYDARPVSSDVRRELQRQTPGVDGVCTHWIHNRERVGKLARIIGRADSVMFAQPMLRHGILSNIRFDATWGEEVKEGLAVASLELSAPERTALRMLPRIPDRLLRLSGVFRSFAKRTQKLVESASGLCFVVAPDDEADTDFLVGRAMQQAWLALTSQDLSVQPMMSLIVLQNVFCQGSSKMMNPSGLSATATLLEELLALAPEIGTGRLAALLRFGFAPPPSGRTGRLPADGVVRGQKKAHTPIMA